MNSLVLNRMSFLPSNETDSERQEFARRLSNELEYEGHKHKLNAAAIARQLVAIRCAPFSPSSVRRYKRWMEYKAAGLIGCLNMMAFTFLFLWGVVAYSMQKSQTAAIGVPAVVLLVICAIATIIKWISFAETQVSWNKTRIAGYTKLIPDAAAETMLRIKDAFPNVGFSVEELIVRKEVKDPFLLAIINGYVFHVAVWDEPEYTPRV